MNTTELKAAESALETALDKVRQLIASERDAEYKAAFDAIWGQPIGEWEPEIHAYIAGTAPYDPYCWGCIADNEMSGLRRQWRKGEIGFGDAGKAELERRLAEQNALDERFGL